ncbi:hypothetical protein B0H11DRAFT_2255691 [Mycena galericulata]|nr:hypothetical protein B0H11DRAFT_2255691 [Mycena galericulata]
MSSPWLFSFNNPPPSAVDNEAHLDVLCLLQSPALPLASWSQSPSNASIARDRVERARAVCENLDRQAQLAAAHLQAAQYILATEQSLFAPIRRLPTEILTEILCLLSHQQGIIALSQVCRTWRSHCTVPAIQRFVVLTSERTYSHNYMGFFPHGTLLAHPDQASWEAPISLRLLSSFLKVPLLWTSFRVERYNELDTVASALLRSTIPRMLNLSSLSLNGHVDQRITTPPSVSSLSLRYVPLGEQVIDCDWLRILTYRETGTRPTISVAHLRQMTSLTTLTLVGVSLPTEYVALLTLHTLRITGTTGIRQKDHSPIGLIAVNLAVLELSGVPHQGAHILPLVNILQARHVERIQADFIQPEEIAELFRLNASLDLELGNEGPSSFFSSLTNIALQALTNLPLLNGTITTVIMPVQHPSTWVNSLSLLLNAHPAFSLRLSPPDIAWGSRTLLEHLGDPRDSAYLLYQALLTAPIPQLIEIPYSPLLFAGYAGY